MVSRSSTYPLNPTPMSNLQPEGRPGDYDDVTRLRLQLHQAELQRDAFEKALRSDVLRIVKHAISMSMVAIEKHVADTVGCQLVALDDLKAENAKLKEENDTLQNRCDFLEGHGQ